MYSATVNEPCILTKSNDPVRVAHVIGQMIDGGVESVVFNYYKNIDKTQYQFDFFYDDYSTREPPQELIDMGARFYKIPAYNHLFQYITTLYNFFKVYNYQIVHSHMNTLSVFALFAAKLAGVPIRIAHNHSTAGKGETKKNVVKYALRPFAKIFPTHLAACSYYSGKWIFGKKANFTVFNNAIDLPHFTFCQEIRDKVRAELDLEGKFVIGHVGRFCFQKNHDFLIDIFAEVVKIDTDAILLLIGEGVLKASIKEKVQGLGIENNVKFLGIRNDVNDLLQGMDVFLLPSRYEGLGMVAIEAQACDLPTICSTAVPREVKVINSCVFLSLRETPLIWKNKILELKNKRREPVTLQLTNHGYNISNEAKHLELYYQSLIKQTSHLSLGEHNEVQENESTSYFISSMEK